MVKGRNPHDICTWRPEGACPLNTVPGDIVDEYLARNAVMREAWEASGHCVGDRPDR